MMITPTKSKDRPARQVANNAGAVVDELVSGHRVAALKRAGYSQETAEKIGQRGDIDLHVACDMRLGGCDDELALEILF